MPLRLTLVTLGVADVAKAAAFYEQLGLTRSSVGAEAVAFFEVGGAILSLYGKADLAADAQIDPDTTEGRGFRGQSLAWNLTSQADVDKAVVRMVAAGGGLVKAAEKTSWGGYAGYVQDPDGHLWEIAHNPGFPFDAEGRLRLPD